MESCFFLKISIKLHHFLKLWRLFFFIALPFIGFYLGKSYQQRLDAPSSMLSPSAQPAAGQIIIVPDVPPAGDYKQTIIKLATKKFQEKYPDKKINIGARELGIDGGWAHGTAGVYTPNSEGGANLYLFIAYWKNNEWHIIFETDPEYPVLFQQLPNTVVSQEVKDFYKNRSQF